MQRPTLLLPDWDPATRAVVLVLASGALFFSVENIVASLLTKPIARQFRSHNPKLNDQKAKDCAIQTVTRLVGLVHHLVLIPLSLYLVSQPKLRYNRLYGTIEITEVVFVISAGFFLHDVIMSIIRIQLEGPLYLVHAVACCFGYAYGLYTNSLHFYAASFLLWEISTPFVHLRWVLYKLNMADKQIYIINGMLMALSFFGCRIVWGTYVTCLFIYDFYSEFEHPTPGGLSAGVLFSFIIPCLMINTLNYFWFSKMMGVAAKLLAGTKGSEVGGDKDT